MGWVMTGIDGAAVLDAAVAIDALEVGSDGSALDMEAERTAIKRMVECLNVQRVCYAAFDEVAACMVVHAMRAAALYHHLPWFAATLSVDARGVVINIPRTEGLARQMGGWDSEMMRAPVMVPGVPDEVTQRGADVATALGFNWVREHTLQDGDRFRLFRGDGRQIGGG